MRSFKPREKELKTYTLKEYEPEFDRKLVGKHIQRLRTIYSKWLPLGCLLGIAQVSPASGMRLPPVQTQTGPHIMSNPTLS